MNSVLIDERGRATGPPGKVVQAFLIFAGICVLLLGLGLGIYLFAGILRVIQEPEGVGPMLDRWEIALRGTARDALAEERMDFELRVLPEGSVALATPSRPLTLERNDAVTTETLSSAPVPAQRPAQFPINGWRIGSIIVLFALLGLLVRITIWLIRAGGDMIGAAIPRVPRRERRPLPSATQHRP
jgi:hypothetical protein